MCIALFVGKRSGFETRRGERRALDRIGRAELSVERIGNVAIAQRLQAGQRRADEVHALQARKRVQRQLCRLGQRVVRDVEGVQPRKLLHLHASRLLEVIRTELNVLKPFQAPNLQAFQQTERSVREIARSSISDREIPEIGEIFRYDSVPSLLDRFSRLPAEKASEPISINSTSKRSAPRKHTDRATFNHQFGRCGERGGREHERRPRLICTESMQPKRLRISMRFADLNPLFSIVMLFSFGVSLIEEFLRFYFPVLLFSRCTNRARIEVR